MDSSLKREPVANPMKKRLLQTWDTKAAAEPKPSAESGTSLPPSSVFTTPTSRALSPKRNLASNATVTSSPMSTDHRSTPRRRYPKLLITDDKGNIIANPLNLQKRNLSTPSIVPNGKQALLNGAVSSQHLQPPNATNIGHNGLQDAQTITPAPEKRLQQQPTDLQYHRPRPEHGMALYVEKTAQIPLHAIENQGLRTTPDSSLHRIPTLRSEAGVAPQHHLSRTAAENEDRGRYNQGGPLMEWIQDPATCAAGVWGSHPNASRPMQNSPVIVNRNAVQPGVMNTGDMRYQSSSSLMTGSAAYPYSGSQLGVASDLKDDIGSNTSGLHPLPTSPLSAGEKAKNGQTDRVIQIGRRSGTVQYWRSSLQMPKHNGVQKPGLKKPMYNEKGFSNVEMPHFDNVSNSLLSNGAPFSTNDSAAPTSNSSGSMHNVISEVPTNKGLANPHATRAPLDTGQVHAYWRNSTKLPSVSSDKARMKRRLAQNTPGDLIAQPAPTSSGLQNSSNSHEMSDHHEFSVHRQQAPSLNGLPAHDGASTWRPLGAPQRIKTLNAVEKFSTIGLTPQMVIDEEQVDIRRLHMTKDYEIRKLEAYAESRYHVKMNLRGRSKLERWLMSTDRVAANSVMFIVLVLNLDRRLVSQCPRERQDALEEMENEHLRMLEALMVRTSTRDGHTNWAVLTENFTPQVSTA